MTIVVVNIHLHGCSCTINTPINNKLRGVIQLNNTISRYFNSVIENSRHLSLVINFAACSLFCENKLVNPHPVIQERQPLQPIHIVSSDEWVTKKR